MTVTYAEFVETDLPNMARPVPHDCAPTWYGDRQHCKICYRTMGSNATMAGDVLVLAVALNPTHAMGTSGALCLSLAQRKNT